MRQSSQPTVEEILESIKQVIASDNRAGAAEVRRERETRGMAERDILDLGADARILDEAGEDEVVDETDEAEDGPLLEDRVQAGISESLAALAMLSQPGARPQIVRSGELRSRAWCANCCARHWPNGSTSTCRRWSNAWWRTRSGAFHPGSPEYNGQC